MLRALFCSHFHSIPRSTECFSRVVPFLVSAYRLVSRDKNCRRQFLTGRTFPSTHTHTQVALNERSKTGIGEPWDRRRRERAKKGRLGPAVRGSTIPIIGARVCVVVHRYRYVYSIYSITGVRDFACLPALVSLVQWNISYAR